jgi:hypothetical protein
VEAIMSRFRTFAAIQRSNAEPMQTVVDPAGWAPEDLADVERWSYRFSSGDIDQIVAAIAHARRAGTPMADLDKSDFPLRALGDTLSDVHRELTDGRGIVILRGFPIGAFSREDTALAFIGLGTHIGNTITQNAEGHVLGHVTDLGGDYHDPNTRGYMTRAELRFHADGCDYVALLCLKPSKSGGESLVASSVTLYNRLLERRPDLVKVLCEDFYVSRIGEINPGQLPWYLQPIFSFTEGYFSATGAGIAIDKARKLPGVPPYTPAQVEAVALYREMVSECATSIVFEPGDIQLLNNFVTLHTRREYEDWPEPGRKRHLLRLWLSDPQGRPIPHEQRIGRAGSGIQMQGVARSAPIEATVAVS